MVPDTGGQKRLYQECREDHARDVEDDPSPNWTTTKVGELQKGGEGKESPIRWSGERLCGLDNRFCLRTPVAMMAYGASNKVCWLAATWAGSSLSSNVKIERRLCGGMFEAVRQR